MKEDDLFDYMSTEQIEMKKLSKLYLNKGYFDLNQIEVQNKLKLEKQNSSHCDSDREDKDIDDMIRNGNMDFYASCQQNQNDFQENIKVITSIFKDKCIAGGSLFLERRESQVIGHIFDIRLSTDYKKRLKDLKQQS